MLNMCNDIVKGHAKLLINDVEHVQIANEASNFNIILPKKICFNNMNDKKTFVYLLYRIIFSAIYANY